MGAADVGEHLAGVFANPGLLMGIPLALAGAVFMSLGAQYQHRGVEKVERLSGSDAATGLSWQQVKGLLTRPSWIVGTLMLVLAIVCQLAALTKAPLIVVQPLGAIALVITTLLNARVSGVAPTKRSLVSICTEMFAAMRKTAMSAIIYEVLDMATGIVDAEGNLASNGAGIFCIPTGRDDPDATIIFTG